MLVSKNYRERIQELAGLVSEDVSLTAEFGRSDSNSLSWYVEEYLLKLGGDILTELDYQVENEEALTLSVSKSSTKIMSNSLVVKLFVEGTVNNVQVNEEILLTVSVNLERDSNTVASVNIKGIINKFNLSSKHSNNDLELFRREVTENELNSIKISTKK